MKIFENTPIKNVPVKTKLSLADEVEYRDGQVVSKTFAQNKKRQPDAFCL